MAHGLSGRDGAAWPRRTGNGPRAYGCRGGDAAAWPRLPGGFVFTGCLAFRRHPAHRRMARVAVVENAVGYRRIGERVAATAFGPGRALPVRRTERGGRPKPPGCPRARSAPRTAGATAPPGREKTPPRAGDQT